MGPDDGANITDEDWARCQEIYKSRNVQLLPSSVEDDLKNAIDEIPADMSPQEMKEAIRTINEQIIKKHSSSSIEDRRYAAIFNRVTNDPKILNAYKEYVDGIHIRALRKCFGADYLLEKKQLSEKEYNHLPPVLQELFEQTSVQDGVVYVRKRAAHVGGGRFRTRRRKKVSYRKRSRKSRSRSRSRTRRV